MQYDRLGEARGRIVQGKELIAGDGARCLGERAADWILLAACRCRWSRIRLDPFLGEVANPWS